MRCPACSFENVADASFCGECAAPLNSPGSCPKCGRANSPKQKFCNGCGQPVMRSRDRAASPDPRSYTPKHLAEKILTSRSALEGERKQVTVLFADLVNYTRLSAQLGEEALFTLMDGLYERLIHEVHRYEGTVNELTGDGLVAFFGAPLAVEQAPQRAVRAALALHEAIAQLNTKTKHAKGVQLQLRVGINTGPVIVGTIGNDLRMDYKAVGQTVNLAARMEQTAAPETIQLTEHTYKLVGGYFECDDLGLMSVKNVAEQVRVYRVRGERQVRTRIDVARERGFTRMVGREHELALLRQSFGLAQGGHGQAVSLTGEAGLGKSRLLHEFRQALSDQDCLWLGGHCQPYGSALAYGPIIEVLRHLFGINAGDIHEDIPAKIHRGLEPLGAGAPAAVPYVCHLLGFETEGGIPAGLAPEAIKRRIFEALRALLCESAARRPLVLAIEDLHWADPTTVEFLTFLVEHIAGAPLLLMSSCRPEFACPWSRKSYHSAITLTPLPQPDGSQMLSAVLGTAEIQGELAALVLDKTEGVPFFIEELVQSLREMNAIELHDGQWRLAAGAAAIPVPDTVEEVVTARIDRLPEGAKGVLQIGAVIGREWSEALVREVAGLEEPALTAHLAALTDAELLYGRGLSPQTTYIFKHAFTQEAAYGSLLTSRRRDLHHRVAVTLEALFPDRLEEYCGPLARHYCEAAQGDEVAKAVAYALRAGARNMALPAHAEAMRFYRMGLQALERQEPIDEARRCALLLALGEAQNNAGEFLEAQETLLRGADIARTLGATESLIRAALGLTLILMRVGLAAAPAVRLLEEALRILGPEASLLRAKTLGGLGRAFAGIGAQHQALVYGEQAVAMARRLADSEVLANNLEAMVLALQGPENVRQRLAYATEMLDAADAANAKEESARASYWCALCWLEVGDILATDAAFDAHARKVDELQQPLYLHLSRELLAMRALMQGRFADSERLAQEARAIGQRLQTETAAGIFGLQMFTLRREQGRLKELEPVVRYFVQQHSAAAAWRPGLALIYSELGRRDEAQVEFEHLAQHDFADLPRDALWMASMTYLVDVCTFLGDKVRAAVLYQLLLPYAEHTVIVGSGVACYGALSRYLGALASTLAHWDEAARHFEDALAMNARMEAWPWLAHTQYRYATMLLARDQPGDGDKARELLKAALLTARELGMRALEERLTGSP
jgi:class 3 adenylate cyclase/tetratricopeptide (TPR) repeat protein